jgi:hypothetical protein
MGSEAGFMPKDGFNPSSPPGGRATRPFRAVAKAG